MASEEWSQVLEERLPERVLEAIQRLEATGSEAWLAGECVRNAMLGRPVDCFHVYTSCRWDEAQTALGDAELNRASSSACRNDYNEASVEAAADADSRISGTAHPEAGAESNTIYVDNIEIHPGIREGGRSVDCKTGSDEGEHDGAHDPTIYDVLSQSSFTMDALAYHPDRGFMDWFGGLGDVKGKVIRAAGNAHDVFSREPLQILAACKLCSQLGFDIDATTLLTMRMHKMRLHLLEPEAIFGKLQEMLLGDHVRDALMQCVDVLAAVLPELYALKGFEQHTPYHIYDVLEHTAWVVQLVPPTPVARWSALLHDFGKPGAFFMDGDRGHFYGHPRLSAQLARGVMDRLHFPSDLAKRVLPLVRMHDEMIPATVHDVERAIERVGGDVETFRTLCQLKRADALAQSDLARPRLELSEELEALLDEIVSGS